MDQSTSKGKVMVLNRYIEHEERSQIKKTNFIHQGTRAKKTKPKVIWTANNRSKNKSNRENRESKKCRVNVFEKYQN